MLLLKSDLYVLYIISNILFFFNYILWFSSMRTYILVSLRGYYLFDQECNGIRLRYLQIKAVRNWYALIQDQSQQLI